MSQSLSKRFAKTVTHSSRALIVTLAGALLSMPAIAAVTLTVDNHVKVTAINGEAYNTSMFQPIQTTFTLEPGTHAITAQYDRLYDNLRGDSHDYLHSDNISVTATLQDNTTYTLTMPNQPERYADAKEYAEHPTLAVTRGNQVIAEETATAPQRNQNGVFSGIGQAIGSVFGGNSANDAQASNQQAIASLENSTTAPARNNNNNASIAPLSVPVTVAPATSNTLDSFMQLWLNATPEERAKIRQWVQQ